MLLVAPRRKPTEVLPPDRLQRNPVARNHSETAARLFPPRSIDVSLLQPEKYTSYGEARRKSDLVAYNVKSSRRLQMNCSECADRRSKLDPVTSSTCSPYELIHVGIHPLGGT